MRINFKHLLFSFLIVTGSLILVCLLTASRSGQKKVTIVFTGGLSNIFHPFGEDPEQKENLEFLNHILTKLKKSYPEALFVDTGNYVNIQDHAETAYATPAMAHFRKHGYHAVNIGSKEIFMGTGIHLIPQGEKKEPPFLVSTLVDATMNTPVASPYADFHIPPMPSIRVLGISALDHSFSAPPLKNALKNPAPLPTLSSHLESLPEPCLTLLLSDLSHSENVGLAGNLTGLDLILESEIDSGKPLLKEKETYLCRRGEQKSVGVVHLKMNNRGKISTIHYQSYPLRKQGGFLFFKKKKIPPRVRPPLPYPGKLIPAERLLKRLSVPHKNYEICRISAGHFSPLVSDPHIYYYAIFDNRNFYAASFYVDHPLGERRPELMFFVTLDSENRILKLDFIIPPMFGNWYPDYDGFLKPYLGKKWNELEFHAQGCEGAVEEFKSLYDDLYLVSRMADELIEKK